MSRRPRVLLAALMATTTMVTAVLCAFGLLLLRQQREIDDRRARAALDARADVLAETIRGRLADAGDRLSAWLAGPLGSAPGIERTILLRVDAGNASLAPGSALPYVPVVLAVETQARFAALEVLEHRDHQLETAAAGYDSLMAEPDLPVRAAALHRLARVLRKAGRFDRAIAVSSDLAKLAEVRVGDVPASLAAAVGTQAALAMMGRATDARQVADQILRDLDRGRWRILRGDAEAYREQFGAGEPLSPAWSLAGAATDVWREAPDGLPARGHRTLVTPDGAALVMWRASGPRVAMLLVFTQELLDSVAAERAGWRVVSAAGDILTPIAQPHQALVERLVSAEYPWKVEVWSPGAELVPGDSRRAALTMLALALVFVWGTTYFMARAVVKEARVSRLQSDFVAAVSHEFRSPLTTVRQVAEMLDSGRVLPGQSDERRRTYYGLLVSETRRLQQLVETLLNFGRMDAGVERYQRTPVDVSGIARRVVDDIASQARVASMRVDLIDRTGGVVVQADEQALSMALRNLIDNAVKYSAGQPAVRVEMDREPACLAIRVIDTGPGIPAAEQHLVFQKFARGASAIRSNIGGTGLGLSMARHVVTAHGGEIEVQSREGAGCTFTLRLPLAEAS